MTSYDLLSLFIFAAALIATIAFLPRLMEALINGLDKAPLRARAAGATALIAAKRILVLEGEHSAEPERHPLRPHEVTTLLGGSLLMSVLCVALLVFGFAFFAPAIAAIFDFDLARLTLPVDFMDAMAQAAVCTVLLVPAIAGVVMADLMGWGIWTPFALIKRGRGGAYKLARATFVISLLIGLAAGAYRGVVHLEPLLGPVGTEQLAAYLGAAVVFIIDPIILVGVLLAAPSLAGVFWITGVAFAVAAWVGLNVLALAAELALLVLRPLHGGIVAFLDRIRTIRASRLRVNQAKLEHLVGSRDRDEP